MRVLLVARKPPEGSVADNALKHGTGALNIDACRLGFVSDEDKWAPGSGGTVYRRYMDGSGQDYGKDHHEPTQNTAVPNEGGRWPPNLVLEHQPECQTAGTRAVRAKRLTAGRRTIKWGVQEGGCSYAKGTGARFATEDGLEAVDAWSCAESCSVLVLGARSGREGASRFFKQVGGTQE